MHFKFDTLFSIKVTHSELPSPGKGGFSRFILTPTPSTAADMKKLGWLFKPIPDGAFIAAEKNVSSDGIPRVIRKLQDTESFSFLLYLADIGLLNHTSPWQQEGKPAHLPSFLGRSRILYFNNLSSDNKLGPTNLSIDNTVSVKDLASIAPNNFTMTAPNSQTSKIPVQALHPDGGEAKTLQFLPGSRILQVSLRSGAYRLKPDSAPQEVLYADSRLFPLGVFALVQIFKDQTLDYDTPIVYTLKFSNT